MKLGEFKDDVMDLTFKTADNIKILISKVSVRVNKRIILKKCDFY